MNEAARALLIQAKELVIQASRTFRDGQDPVSQREAAMSRVAKDAIWEALESEAKINPEQDNSGMMENDPAID